MKIGDIVQTPDHLMPTHILWIENDTALLLSGSQRPLSELTFLDSPGVLLKMEEAQAKQWFEYIGRDDVRKKYWAEQDASLDQIRRRQWKRPRVQAHDTGMCNYSELPQHEKPKWLQIVENQLTEQGKM